MARRTQVDELGLPRVMNVDEAPQLRDGFGRSKVSTNPRITGAAPVVLTQSEYRDPSLATFRQGISHWSRFDSIYRQVASMKRKQPTRTAPELLTDLLLNKMGVAFQSQIAVGGGKLSLGGGVIDFLIPEQSLALNIHGHYFHDEREAQTEWIGLIGKDVNGVNIRRYTYVWDNDLYRYDNGLAITYALVGIQL